MAAGTENDDWRRFFRHSVLVYVLVNVPLILVTYDAFNLNGNILSTSYLALGLNPYGYGSTVGVGYLILPGVGYQFLSLNAVSWLVYAPSGYSLLAASIAAKSVGVAAGIGLAWVGRAMVRDAGLPHDRAVFLALLFNPYLIFVTAVWGGTESLVVFLLLLGIWAFRRGWVEPVNYPAVMLGAVALVVVVFSYYFAALLIPAIIYYLPNRRHIPRAVAILAGGLAIFGFPVVAYHLLSSGTVNLGTSNPLNAYSVLNLLGTKTAATVAREQVAFLVVAAGLALVAPEIFRRWGLDLFTSLLSVTALGFSLTFFLPGDAFAILAPLALMALAFAASARFSLARAFVVQAFLLPIFVIVQMVNGPGQVTGVYYWSYFLLQKNVILYPTLGGHVTLEIALGVYAAGAVATIGAIWWLDLGRRRAGHPREAESTPQRPFSPSPLDRSKALRVGAIALILVVVCLVAAYADSAGTTLALDGQFNTQEFYAYDAANPGLYPLESNATYSATPSTGTLSFAAGSPPIGFARNVADQSTELAFNASVEAPTNRGPVPLLESSHVTVLYSTALRTDSIGMWTATSTGNASSIVGETSVTVGSLRVYVTNGSQAIQYEEPLSSVAGSIEYFAAEFSQESSVRTVLWSVYAGPIEVLGYLQGQTFYLGTNASGQWKYAGTLTGVSPEEWMLGGFEIDANLSAVTAFVDNERLTLPAQLPSVGSVTIFTGKENESSSANRRFALIGVITPLYSGAAGAAQFQNGFYAAVGSPFSAVVVATGSSIRVAYTNSASGSHLVVNTSAFGSSVPDKLLIVGKLGFCPGNISIQFSQVQFSRESPGPNLAWVLVGFGLALPGWLAGWSLYRLGAFEPFARKRP